MSQFDLTGDQRQIRQSARRFMADAITPHAAEWDETHHCRRDVIRAAAELGFGAIKVTEDTPDKIKFAAMAKRLATDTGSAIVDRALRLHGGYGYLQDYPIERFFRDLRVHRILEGTMRVIVAHEMTRQ